MTAKAPDVEQAYAKPFAAREQLDAYASIATRQFGRGEMVACWARRDRGGLGLGLPNARNDVFLTVVNLRGSNAGNMWRDERHMWRSPMPAGGVVILDQRHSWVAEMPDPFELVQLFIPLRALNELADELRAAPIENLLGPVQSPQPDEVLLHLARALLPALAKPKEASALFADHVFGAIRIHLARTYGGLSAPPEGTRGGLAPWQERRAKELLLDDLQVDPSLTELAHACGMSVRHLSRAFKTTTGLPPHRWLLRRRVERAKELLEGTDESLSAIALACGFADQSHLTRVFQALAGSSPGAWRRHRRA